MDMRPTITPKSDQLNADDLIAGPRTVTITGVKAAPRSAEQPVAVYFEGDNGKPYMPCKSMRRVMVAVWGPDASQYAGRSMTLFRDPTVTWGGMEVGGIRISHMTDMEAPVVLALTATKKARKPHRVLPLVVAKLTDEPPPEKDTTTIRAEGLAAKFAAVVTAQDFYNIVDNEADRDAIRWLKDKRPELFTIVDTARQAAAARMQETPVDDAPAAVDPEEVE